MLEVLVHRCRRRSFLFLSIFFLLFQLVAGQTLINGQTFTNGLAIIDSPSPQNPGNAGSSSFSSLEIYLVSAETNINMTVSAGSALLSGESGSTVKHLNWPISTCIPAGNYNLTFYESSVYNSQGVFAITPIPVPISNPNPAGPCTENLNAVQAQPQSSNPLPQSPFAPGLASAPSSSVTPTSVVPTSTRMVTVISGTALRDADTDNLRRCTQSTYGDSDRERNTHHCRLNFHGYLYGYYH
ncbi:hypothetical protein MSAN_02179000 [Mycena sanguinolenta]|uniref:Uncharacterized protein n=1 Tax=Mycena sanguinolenta TaxID=230812 RepID=A0A8H7CKT8_9AGAR|nr:hypothetical protein MSAN_02179000 [Mycena sanguinolenta]